MSISPQHGHRWLLRTRTSSWPSVVTGAKDINRDLAVPGPDTDLGSSSGPDDTVASGGKQTTQSVYLPLTHLLQVCLFPQDSNHSASSPCPVSPHSPPCIYLLKVLGEPMVYSTCLGQLAPEGTWVSFTHPLLSSPSCFLV